MIHFCLQITQTINSLNDVINTSPNFSGQNETEAMTIFEMVYRGGILMIPIALLSIVSVYIFIERFLTIRRQLNIEVTFMNSIHDFIRKGKPDSALTLCRNTSKPIARMIEKGILRIGKPIKEIEESIEIAGKFEIYNLEKNIQILAVIAGIAPMFGFLGTIIGVIKIFGSSL